MPTSFVGSSPYIADRIGIRVTLVAHVDWQERERRFDAGDIDVCWICGLPYVWKADSGAAIELLGAPVMQRERYGGRPVYFSDVVTRSSSGYESFAQLRGVRWVTTSRAHTQGTR